MTTTTRSAFLVAFVLGLIGLGVVAARAQRPTRPPVAYPLMVAAVLKPGDMACQQPLGVPRGGVDAIRFTPDVAKTRSQGRGGPELVVSLRDLRTHRVLTRGVLPRGHARGGAQTVSVPHADSGDLVAVCVRSRGPGEVGLWGEGPGGTAPSDGQLNGAPTGTDLHIEFPQRPETRSLLSLLPTAISRAAVFKVPGTTTWMLWVLIATLVLGGAALLTRALSDAFRDERRLVVEHPQADGADQHDDRERDQRR